MTVRRADHGFRQLAAWRDELADAVFAVWNVVSLDLDERRNRIAVGVVGDRAEAEAAIARRATDAGIPITAVVIDELEEIEDPVDGDTASVPGTLTDAIRPLTAGIQITWDDAAGARQGCTLGYVGYYWHNGNRLQGRRDEHAL